MNSTKKNIEGDEIIVAQGQDKVWAYHPNLPVSNSPVFRWPPRLSQALKWFAAGWFRISGATLWVALAFVTYSFLQPMPDFNATIDSGWIALMLLRNLTLILIVAGSLHLLLYKFTVQNDQLEFDRRKVTRGAKYTFNNQVYDNMFWSIVWGVPIWTFYEALYFYGFASDSVPVLEFSSNPILFIAMFWFVLLWKAVHFYWVHRFLHWKPYYDKVHSVHHRNINTGPWSGLSMHPLETLPYFSGVLIHFIIPSHPVHFLFHVYALALNPAFSHSGFDALIIKGKRVLELGEFFHQLHHRYYTCNYGTPEMPWDKWCRTFHNGTQADTQRLRERM